MALNPDTPRWLLRRYLNSAAAKALFRAGRIEDAEAMAALFTRHGEQVNSLTDMQCMWYEIEAGAAHYARGHYGKVRARRPVVAEHSMWDCVKEKCPGARLAAAAG